MQLSRPRPGHLRPRTRPLKFGLEAKAWPWGLHHWHVMRLCSWDFIWEITKCLTQVTSLMLAHRTTVWRRSWAVQRYGTLTVRSVLCYQDGGGQRRVRRRNQHPCRQLLRDLTWLCVPMKNSSLAWQWLVRISPSSSSSSSFVLNQAAWPININIYITRYCLTIFMPPRGTTRPDWQEASCFLPVLLFVNQRKVKEVDLYSAFIVVPHTQGAQVRITQCYLQITPYLPLPLPTANGASPDCSCGHLIAAYYSFIYPERMKGWVGLVGWPTADGLPT